MWNEKRKNFDDPPSKYDDYDSELVIQIPFAVNSNSNGSSTCKSLVGFVYFYVIGYINATSFQSKEFISLFG